MGSEKGIYKYICIYTYALDSSHPFIHSIPSIVKPPLYVCLRLRLRLSLYMISILDYLSVY